MRILELVRESKLKLGYRANCSSLTSRDFWSTRTHWDAGLRTRCELLLIQSGVASDERWWRYKMSLRRSDLEKLRSSGAFRSLSIVVLLMVAAVLAAAVHAYSRRTPKPASVARISPVLNPPQSTGGARGSLYSKLYFQPEADKLRRRLGQRFQSPGREVAVLTGVLKVGNDTQAVRIIRNQTDDGEQVAIALGNGSTSLSWTASGGALSAGNVASDTERSLIERIALDSPDQFVLAQLRASYYTLARRVMPEEAHGSDDYTGPVWDVVRVGEPPDPAQSKVQGPWRLYYINSTTGLLERVVSQDQETSVTAEVSGWVDQGGEQVPTHITWSRDGLVIMDMQLTGVTYAAHQ